MKGYGEERENGEDEGYRVVKVVVVVGFVWSLTAEAVASNLLL